MTPPSPLKLLFVADGAGGGAGIAAQRLMAALRTAGHEVRFLVHEKSDGAASEWLEPRSLNESRGLARKFWKVVAGARRGLADLARWNRRRRRDRFFHGRPDRFEITTIYLGRARLENHPWFQWADVVHLHWTAGFLSPAQAWRAKPWVISLHDANPFTAVCHFPGDCTGFEAGCPSCPQLEGTRNPLRSAAVFQQKQAGYGTGGRITLHAPSQWIAGLAAKSTLAGMYPSKVIPNLFPTDIFRRRDHLASRDLLGLPEEPRIGLFVAGHVANARKGFPWFLRLAEALLGSSWLFVIVGSGDLPSLPENCRSLGKLTDLRLMASVYSAADLFISTTLQDTVPATVVESQLCGTPVVGFAVGGQPEMVESGTTGFLSNAIGLEGLLDGIAWFESTRPDPHQVAKYAQKRWNQDLLTRQWIEFYRGLV